MIAKSIFRSALFVFVVFAFRVMFLSRNRTAIPLGTVISMVEEKALDRGRFARAGGTSCMIVGHSDDGKKSRIRLPSGQMDSMGILQGNPDEL